MTPQMKLKNRARYAANPLDYRRVIVQRSFSKNWRPRDPRMNFIPIRNQVAFANR